MDYPCDCDHPDISLLRVVLIGEIIRAEEAELFTLAEVCEAIGLLQLVDEDDDPEPLPPPTPPAPRKKRPHTTLRRIK